jgi:PAS domain-containing protein
MFLINIQKLVSKISLNTNKRLFTAISILNAILTVLIIVCLIYLFNQRNLLDNCGKNINQELVNLSKYRYESFNLEKNINFSSLHYSDSLENGNNIISYQINTSRDNILEIKNNIEIRDVHYIENIEALITDYESLQKENDMLLGYIVQLGDEGSGIYSKLLNTIADFRTKYKVAENQINFSNRLEQLQSLINLLKSTRNDLLIYQIQSELDLMTARMVKSSNDSSNYVVFRVYDALQNVKNVFYEYARKSLEIGSYPEKGILNKLYVRYNKIESRLSESLKIVYVEKKSRNIKSIVFLLILLIALPVINLFVFYFFIKRERSYRQLFEKYIEYLNKGVHLEINQKDVLPDIYDVINQFKIFSAKFIEAGKILEKLAQGNLNITISKENQFETFHSSFIKIRAIIDNLNQQIINEKRLQSQMLWIKSGIDKLTEVMRRQYDNPLLHANEIINMLIDYLKIPLGAIYLINEENGVKYVELASAFAYGREKQFYKKMAVGEGIVGASASEKKTLNITNIPENYFSIISGFGETKPKNIIASPIKLNEEIFGVIELASLVRFTNEEIGFIEEVCKTVAYSFAISTVYMDTLSQFESSNLQIAELEAENESLKNDYEDINQDYKTLVTKSFDNEFLVSKFNDISIRLCLDIDGNILEVNSWFENLFRSDRKKFILTNYRDYMTDAVFTENIDFEYFWKDIRAGVQQEIDTGIKIASEEFWLKQFFFPVRDDLGRVKKIQLIAFDITDQVKIEKELQNLKKS